MGIYIKGAPSAGEYKLDFIITENGVEPTLIAADGTTFSGCIVKTPHGHLKDNDYVVMWGDDERNTYGNTFDGGAEFLMDYVDALPTVIEGES